MSNDHITVRISKRAVLIALLVVLVPAAFVTGLMVGDNNSTSVAGDTTVATTTTSLTPDTTAMATTTTVSAAATTKKSTPTTVAKKKKIAATTTTLAPLSVKVTYSDNCPPPNTANNRIQGTMTISWTSTSAVSARLEYKYGSTASYYESNFLPNDSYTQTFTCNNVKLADGSYPGTPLTLWYRVTVFDAEGKTSIFTTEDSF